MLHSAEEKAGIWSINTIWQQLVPEREKWQEEMVKEISIPQNWRTLLTRLMAQTNEEKSDRHWNWEGFAVLSKKFGEGLVLTKLSSVGSVKWLSAQLSLQVWQPEFSPWDPRGRRRLTPTSHLPVHHSHPVIHVCPHIYGMHSQEF